MKNSIGFFLCHNLPNSFAPLPPRVKIHSLSSVLSLLAAFGLAAPVVHATLGETLDQLKAHMGKPEPQTRKDAAVWFYEVTDGRLLYTVTFDAQGRSIAEGLKPLRSAIFTKEIAEDFINAQLAATRGSKTVHSYKPGEKYTFGGQQFTCAKDEYVTVDDANDVAIIWNRGRAPSVVAFRKEMLGK